MIRCTHVELCIKEGKQICPEFACEDFISVQHDGHQHTMQFNNGVEDSSRHRRSRVRMFQGNKLGVFGESINDHKDEIIPSRFWESLDEIN